MGATSSTCENQSTRAATVADDPSERKRGIRLLSEIGVLFLELFLHAIALGERRLDAPRLGGHACAPQPDCRLIDDGVEEHGVAVSWKTGRARTGHDGAASAGADIQREDRHRTVPGRHGCEMSAIIVASSKGATARPIFARATSARPFTRTASMSGSVLGIVDPCVGEIKPERRQERVEKPSATSRALLSDPQQRQRVDGRQIANAATEIA